MHNKARGKKHNSHKKPLHRRGLTSFPELGFMDFIIVGLRSFIQHVYESSRAVGTDDEKKEEKKKREVS